MHTNAHVHRQSERKGEQMRCEAEYCIYNKNRLCSLQKIQINSQGMCDDCLHVSLDTALLNAEKERQLREIKRKLVEKYNT